MAEITSVTSEALQATVRRLLPSQKGFGEDLQASNVILPIVDLTPTAEGTFLRQDLQKALDKNVTFTSAASGANTNITSTPGFYTLFATIKNSAASQGNLSALFEITDNLSATTVVKVQVFQNQSFTGELPVIYVNSGETLRVFCETDLTAEISSRQVADINGNLQNPAGFTFE